MYSATDVAVGIKTIHVLFISFIIRQKFSNVKGEVAGRLAAINHIPNHNFGLGKRKTYFGEELRKCKQAKLHMHIQKDLCYFLNHISGNVGPIDFIYSISISEKFKNRYLCMFQRKIHIVDSY